MVAMWFLTKRVNAPCKANLALFEKDPAKYAPAYGGFCAFGVSVGKKFVGDPEVWRVVGGKLYLNLDGASSLWVNGGLIGKPASVFTSTATLHGDQKSTLMTMHKLLILNYN